MKHSIHLRIIYLFLYILNHHEIAKINIYVSYPLALQLRLHAVNSLKNCKVENIFFSQPRVSLKQLSPDLLIKIASEMFDACKNAILCLDNTPCWLICIEMIVWAFRCGMKLWNRFAMVFFEKKLRLIISSQTHPHCTSLC